MWNASEVPVLDRTVVERLRSLEESGDPALVDELVRDFGQITPHRLVELRELVSLLNFAAIANEAGALAESCRTLGLEQMRKACKQLEEVARLGDAEDLPHALVHVERSFLEAHQALEALDIASASP